MTSPIGVRLYVGGDAGKIQGEIQDWTGDRCFSAAIRPKTQPRLREVVALLDSGAFTDAPEERISCEEALERQLRWEAKQQTFSGDPGWQVQALVSYDRLIDETWVAGERIKRRWSLQDADSALEETISAARYLASQRERVAPRRLVLAAQGVDALQYSECAAAVLQQALPGDWFGFGGWCILGRNKRLLPEFWRTIHLVLPMVRVAGLRHVHIFGVMWPPALGGLLHLADEYGLTVSTDSSAPMIACTWSNAKKAGVRCTYWRDNVAYWVNLLANLRHTEHYKAPPDIKPTRQLYFFEEWQG